MSFFSAGPPVAPLSVMDLAGNALIGATILVQSDPGGATVTLYADRAKSSTVGNPYTVDGTGQVSFFVDPGDYLATITSGSTVVTRKLTVFGDPADPAYRDRTVVDIVADYGADPTGVADDSAKFAQANTDLVNAGGGMIQLRAYCNHQANITLGPKVSLSGHGAYSQITGVQGAGVPVVSVPNFDGNFISQLRVNGNQSGVVNTGRDPGETGIYLAKGAAPSPWNPTLHEVYVFDTGGYGVEVVNVQNLFVRGLRTFWTSNTGLYISNNSDDGFVSDAYVLGILGSATAIYAGGQGWQWVNCQAAVTGQISIGGAVAQWDPSNTTAIGWVVGDRQDMWNCRSEDNPVGFSIQGGGSRVKGSSGGDRIPVQVSQVSGSDPYRSNDIDVTVECNDRFVPTLAVDLRTAFANRVTVKVNWQSNSAGPHAESGTIQAKAGFVVIKDNTSGFGGIYNNNEYRVAGEDAWKFYQASGTPTIAPDLTDGLNYYITLDANVTINNLVHRGGVAGGRRIRFLFDNNNQALPLKWKVTWNASYNDARQPSWGKSTSSIHIIEFVQENNDFAAATWRYVGEARPWRAKAVSPR